MNRKPLFLLAGAIVGTLIWVTFRSDGWTNAEESSNDSSADVSQLHLILARIEKLENRPVIDNARLDETVQEQQQVLESLKGRLEQLSTLINATATSPKREEFDLVVAAVGQVSTQVKEMENASQQHSALAKDMQAQQRLNAEKSLAHEHVLDKLGEVTANLNAVLADLETKSVAFNESLSALRDKTEVTNMELKQIRESTASRTEVAELTKPLETIQTAVGELQQLNLRLQTHIDGIQAQSTSVELIMKAVFGKGIVSGLDVLAVPGSGDLVAVRNGSAVSDENEFLVLSKEILVSVNQPANPDQNLYLLLVGNDAVKVWKGLKPPGEAVVLAQVTRNGTELTVDTQCRSKNVLPVTTLAPAK